MKNKKLLGAGLLVVLIAVFWVAYGAFREKPVEGSKRVTIEVVNKADESKEYEVTTDAEFLRQAMEEAQGLEFSGQESEYGADDHQIRAYLYAAGRRICRPIGAAASAAVWSAFR